MAWYLQWSDALKKRACRYLLQRYLGQYLQEKLTLNQLSIDLYNGTGTITDVNLDVQALNEVADTYNLPIEFIDGYIRSISVSIPWSALLNDSSFVEVQGLMATVQPKQRSGCVSVVNSMWGSMTTSMQLAEECLRQDSADNDKEPEVVKPFEGLERFAQTIESVLCRIKVRFVDSTFRLEHVPKGSSVGVALELRIKQVDFFDEAGTESGSVSELERHRNVHEPAAFTCKNFHLEGVTLHTDEFPSKARTFSKSVISVGSSPETKNFDAYSTAPDTPDFCPQQNSIFESCFSNLSSQSGGGGGGDSRSNVPLSNLATQSDPILVAKLTGRHEIRLKVKQCDTIPGPKVSIDCSMGSVVIFSSPRQVHIMLELCRGLVSPDLEDDSNVARHYVSSSKPMQPLDFERVEQELQKHLTPHVPGRSLHHHQGWSSQSLEDSDDEFHPIDGTVNRMTGSTASNASSQFSDSESMISSSNARHTSPGFAKTRRQLSHGPLHLLVDDAMAELTHFKMQLSSLVVIILHDNILTPGASSSGQVTHSSILQMKAQSDAFFTSLGVFLPPSCSDRDLSSAHEKLSSVCQANHLRFIAAPFTIEGAEKASSSLRNLNLTMSIGIAELVECLFDQKPFSSQPPRPEYSTLLGFNLDSKSKNDNLQSMSFVNLSYAAPCIKVKLSHWERISSKSTRLRKVSSPPRTDVHVELSPCHSEVDITIVDRISCLLDQQDLCNGLVNSSVASASTRQPSNHGYLSQAMDELTPGNGRKIDVSVSSSLVTICVRFPVPDMRPLHDMDRMPWWKRTIRTDILTLEMTEFRFHSVFCDVDCSQQLDFRCRELHGLFQETANDPPVSFLHASPGNGGVGTNTEGDDGFDWPRLIVKIRSPVPALVLEEQAPEDSDDPMHTSTLDTLVHDLCSSDGVESSPFSTRKVMYKSDNIGNNNESNSNDGRKQRNDNFLDADQMVLPGERSEAAEFIERSTANSLFVVELSLANVNVVLPSKHFFEVLYNRISTDTLLWDRAAPRPAGKGPSGVHPPPVNHDWANNYMQETVYQTFSMCKSALRYDSSSDSEEEKPAYISYGEHKQRLKRQPNGNSEFCRQNRVCFTLTSKHAAITLHTPLRDSVEKVIPEHEGEIQLQVVDVTFFIVSTAPNSPTSSFMCLHSNRAAIYHNGVLCHLPTDFGFRVGPTTLATPGHLFPTLYPSEDGIHVAKQTGVSGSAFDSPDMLLLAVRVNFDSVRCIRTFRVALGVRGATLRHRVCLSSESWFSQLIDFFNVVDYPVMGYKTPEVITELHLHTWGCAVDYRPLFLPLRVVLTVETFSICSNIAAQTSSSVVRVILEDACLFLSKKLDEDNVDLKRDYVCVVDVGFFELSLRLSDHKDHRQPKVDLRASNNILRIRTCVDSCQALQDLMGYFASDGDLRDVNGELVTAAFSEVTLNEENDFSTLTNVEEEQVHNLMAEAMKESNCNSRASSESETTASNSEQSPSDVFLFPDEARIPSRTAASATLTTSVAVHEEQDENQNSSPSDDSLDDDFCILENDPGVGIVSRSGEPQVRCLTTDHLIIVENHFAVPFGRTDQLKAPKHFPTPILRYTLREISLVWHLYGGNDFPLENQGTRKGQETKSRKNSGSDKSVKSDGSVGNNSNIREKKNYSVTFSKTNSGEVHWRPSSTSPTMPIRSSSSSSIDGATWWTCGGSGREHDVLVELQMNKVRFQHEKYPETVPQSSRQILLIHEVEIRDRLAASQMNKFLYLYSSESMPRQSHANMVVIKALHLRPDSSGSSQECALKVSLLPLRLNIDQDALFFLYNFFGSLSAGGRDDGTGSSDLGDPLIGGCANIPPPSSSKASFSHQVPVMSVATTSPPPPPTNSIEVAAPMMMTTSRDSDSQNLMLLFDGSGSHLEEAGVAEHHQSGSSETCESPAVASHPVFFRSFLFSPEVPIRLDYHGKRVDMEQGALAGLLIGLGQLNCSELRLKRLSYRHGLLGIDRLLTYALSEWLLDVRQTQLPGVLGGVGPLHSVVQLFQGFRDLFWLPIEQYRKDGRIIRGLQRGANAFTTSTAMAALELANRLVQAVQCTAETAYDVVSPGPSVRSRGVGGRPRQKRQSQPADIREGMANAFQVVREGLGDTARTLVQVAAEEHEHKGISGAVGGVLRQIPPTVVKPIILATEATSNVLGGMKHQLAPDVRREAAEKWRCDD